MKTTPSNHILCDSCLSVYTAKIRDLDTAAPGTWEFIFPAEIKPNIPAEVMEDITTLLYCLHHELWTAAAVMGARILNYSIRWYYYFDVSKGITDPSKDAIDHSIEVFNQLDFSEIIKKMEEQGYFKSYVFQFIRELREMRDHALQSSYLFPQVKSFDICRKVLFIVAHIYNYCIPEP